MAKMTIMVGLPASGKTTRAFELLKQGSTVRINRDNLREMLHNAVFTGQNEGITLNIAKTIAKELLTNNMSVIIDDTNLNPKVVDMWKGLAKETNAKIQYERMDTSMEVCIERDKSREKKVGRDVIVNMALQYGMYPKPENGFVLCDLDGTLCDITHRLQYAKGETKDWGKFFAGIPEDSLRASVAEMLDQFVADGHKIIFVSARPDTYRKETEEWLYENIVNTKNGSMKNAIPFQYETLIMRRGNDKRDDVDVKRDIYNQYFKDKYPIETVIDDRPKVIRMWREEGLNVIDVGAGVEF